MIRGWFCKFEQCLSKCLGFGLICAFSLGLIGGCAPTPDEVRSSNMWTNFGEDLIPPIPPDPVKFVRETAPMQGSPGDVSIWQNPKDPRKSMFFGIDESKRSTGLYSYGLDAKLIERISDIQFPKDVEVEYGFITKEKKRVDIVAVLERDLRQIRFYGINPTTLKLKDLTGSTGVFKDLIGPEGSPMGIALFRDRWQRMFVFVSRKVSDGGGVIWQYELKSNRGKIDLVFVREFGKFVGKGIVEQLMVDDGNQYLYYYDKIAGVRKYLADASAADSDREISTFGGYNGTGFQGQMSGVGLYITPAERGKGLIVLVDKRAKESAIKTFKREGEINNPNHQNKSIDEIVLDVDSSSGIDITSLPIKNEFPEGFIVMGHSTKRNYRIFSWKTARTQRENHIRNLRRERNRNL